MNIIQMTEKEKQEYAEINKILDDIDDKNEKEIEEKIKKGKLIPVRALSGDGFSDESIKTLLIKSFINKYKDKIDMSKIKEIKDIINFYTSDEFYNIEASEQGK